MSKEERKLSEYIDALNAEKEPAAHKHAEGPAEQEKLNDTVRLIRSLKEPVLPEADYPKRVACALAGQLSKKPASGREGLSNKSPAIKRKRLWLTGVAAAMVIVMLFAVNSILPFGGTNIVSAMEQAFQGVKAYHGILEIVEINADGEETTQAKCEIWADREGHYYIKGIDGAQKDLVTVNNGVKKWQIRPDQKQVFVFPVFPDPYLFTFELGREVEGVKSALETKVIGEEMIAGRNASILEVTPDGGVPYRLWIDKETILPLQKQSGMQNALQYKVTYTEIDFSDAVPADLMAYSLPAGFEEIDTNPEQLMNNMQEVGETVGFLPIEPVNLPDGYERDSIAVAIDTKIVKFYYTSLDKKSRVIVLQGKADAEFKPASTAILGKVNNNIAEVQSPVEENLGILSGGGAYTGVTDITSIRWQEDGIDYAVVGDVSLEVLTSFVSSLSNGVVQIPTETENSNYKPQIEVPVDLELEENEQKSVDAGHSPWKLDPVFVAQVFVSLKISPEGIVGDYPVKYEDLSISQNTGETAIVEVNDSKAPVRRVYLKRLIRKDSTGIWTVVGYDPMEE